MTEGVFPKIDGDIAYASEYNRMAGAGRAIAMGSTIQVTSGTGVQTLGSFLIGPGSLTNPCMITVDFNGTRGSVHRDVWQIGVSGLDTNTFIDVGSGMPAGAGNDVECTMLLGSDTTKLKAGTIYATAHTHLIDQSLSSSRHTGAPVVGLNTGSPIVIFLNISGTVDSVKINSYSIQSFRNAQ